MSTGGKVTGVTGKVTSPPVNRGKNDTSDVPPELTSQKLIKALKFTEDYLVTPTCFASVGTGIASFISHHIFKMPDSIICKLAEWASKAAVFSTSVFGSLRNAYNRDSFGTLAFSVDFFTSIFAGSENLYLWKGFGSGLDHTPLILTEVSNHPKIVKEYKLEKGHEDAFNHYSGFWDSAKKMFSATKVILADIANEFKNKNFGDAFKSCFLDFNGDRTAEKNLLVSGIGIIGGAVISFLPKCHTIGAALRDLFGIYADLSYYNKGVSATSGNLDSQSKKHYRRSGIEYTVGSVLDLIYRFTGIEAMNLLALGVDRWGACDAVKGIVREIEEKRDEKLQGEEEIAQPAPSIAVPQPA